MEIPLKGELSEYSIPKIFIELNKKRETGILSVSTARFTKKVYFKEGDAIFAGSSLEDDRLGEMLLKWGKINLDQYHRSVELLKETGKRQGQILVELGYLTPKELYQAVKSQVKEIIYSLFGLDHGEYEFLPGPLPTEEVITLRMSMGNLVYEGIKRLSNWSMLKRQIPDDLILQLSSNPLRLFQSIEFSETDEYIKTNTTSPEARNYLALAYLKTGDYNLAEKMIKEAIKLKPTSEYYTNLGLIYTKMGFIDDAINSFKTALELNPSNKKAREHLMRYQKNNLT